FAGFGVFVLGALPGLARPFFALLARSPLGASARSCSASSGSSSAGFFAAAGRFLELARPLDAGFTLATAGLDLEGVFETFFAAFAATQQPLPQGSWARGPESL